MNLDADDARVGDVGVFLNVVNGQVIIHFDLNVRAFAADDKVVPAVLLHGLFQLGLMAGDQKLPTTRLVVECSPDQLVILHRADVCLETDHLVMVGNSF